MFSNFYFVNAALVTVTDIGTAFDDRSFLFALTPHCNSLFHPYCSHQAVIARKV